MLELRTADRKGLLADVTQTLREHGLSVTRAEVSTKAGVATNSFYVADPSGRAISQRTVDAITEKISVDSLELSDERGPCSLRKWSRAEEETASNGGGGVGLFHLGSIVKRNLFNLGLIRSCTQWALQAGLVGPDRTGLDLEKMHAHSTQGDVDRFGEQCGC